MHGALIVLDPNFTSDDMASALGIPVNKATVRRHLASEFETLVKQARSAASRLRFTVYFDLMSWSNFLVLCNTKNQFLCVFQNPALITIYSLCLKFFF